jgi:hypothetical protein
VRDISTYEDMSHEARELVLYMENELAWYNGINWVNGTLAQHWVNNRFDLDLGIKAYARVTMDAAKQYHREHGSMSDSVYSVFPKFVRDQVCEFLARSFVATVRQPEVWADLGERAERILNRAKRP